MPSLLPPPLLVFPVPFLTGQQRSPQPQPEVAVVAVAMSDAREEEAMPDAEEEEVGEVEEEVVEEAGPLLRGVVHGKVRKPPVRETRSL